MAGETSWINHYHDSPTREVSTYEPFSDLREEYNKDPSTTVSIELILPDDLLERILAHLPIASILRAGSVCKRWHEIVSSRRFLWNFSDIRSQKPWYFMFTSSDETTGYSYDPVLRKWYAIDLPCIDNSHWFISSSNGLICVMDSDSRSRLHVCNLIMKQSKKLPEPPGLKFSDYSALAISVNIRVPHSYIITIVKSKQVPGNFFQWDISIHMYRSETMMWTTSLTEILNGWRGGDESVTCDGVLYFLIYSTGGGGGGPENRHGLIGYDLMGRQAFDGSSLIKGFIPVPCPLTCGRLMNLKEKLVMVGGIGKLDRTDIIKGIGIWVLKGREWEEIAKMPHKFFQGFGELDEFFASSGTDELIYIQSYGAPALLIFDMRLKQWRWSQKCPVTKKFPLQLFTGFCFEPRLEIEP